MPAIADYRRALAAALDDGGVYLAAAAGATAITIQPITTQTPQASEHAYDGAWVYLADGGPQQQRRVSIGGFTPSTGRLAFDFGWYPPVGNATVEITHLFPCWTGPGSGASAEDPSYVQLVNHALARLWAPDRLVLPITTADQYSLSAYPWLDRPERLVRVLAPSPAAGRAAIDASWRGPRLVLDGPAPMLQISVPFASATGSLTLEVRRPGNTLASGVETTEGLVNEGQTALCSVADVVELGLESAYRVLANRSPGRPSPTWTAKYETQRERVNQLSYLDRTQAARTAAQAPGEAA